MPCHAADEPGARVPYEVPTERPAADHAAPLRRVTSSCGGVILLLLGGCAGYQVGTQSLYAPNITTVHVPMFESDSFRPYLGQWLTEAVVKQIQLKTPYGVVDSATADTILTGRILSVRKSVQVEDPYDNPRDIEVAFKVEVSWVDRHGGLIHPPTSIALPAALVSFSQASTLVPEGGQSIATANQEAIVRLAEQIVATMEVPW